jgi:protein TonB
VAPIPPPVTPVAQAEPVAAAPTTPTAPPPAAPAPPAPLTAPSFNAAYLNNPAPAYPALSRRTGEEGKVILRVLVNEKGLPDDVQVRTSSGHARLDDAAAATVRQWKFVPARRGDSATPAWVLVPISFSLRS